MTAPAAGATDDAAVYTYGWDTAFAIPVPDVNQAIIDHKSSPPDFSITEPTFSVTGNFGDWQVCQGGDGKAVRMIWPLSQVVLTYTSTGKQLTFPDGHAVVEVELHYIPHTGAEGSFTGNPQALVVNPTASTPTVPPLSIIDVQLTPPPGTVSGALVQQALLDWGTAHLADFAHVFAVVDLNPIVDTGQWGFVTPNYTDYAYLDGDSLQDSVLGVLCMTGTRTGDQLPEQVSQAAIPSGSVAGFVVSQARMLNDLVRPAIMLAYPGLTDGNFLLNSDATELYLTEGTSIPLAPVVQDGSPYYPSLTNLTVTAEGSTLILNSYTSTDIVEGITATCQATNWYTITLGTSSNGQTLSFTATQQPDIVHSIHQSPGSILTQFIIMLVGTLALGILAVLTDGAALVVGGLVIGLILGASQITPALIEKLNGDDSPAIDLLLANAVDPIVWTASSGFSLDYAGLNVSLQLGGDPLFA
ncbi:TULIP family P47-like protein [Actinoallomurus purpureus]|uniref:TULIP family P47-like protein n=1 Tax=Actinoallomurus purpureus TaxID=478114 RepID=UPI0020937DD1|nr:TULIP family P47-like protein [Actinoallomurus purpureus]MCO6010407.1 TULIP family P47-like protein [Actinoallomurus purpureus]